jgi:hypothetical protein
MKESKKVKGGEENQITLGNPEANASLNDQANYFRKPWS